MRTATPLVTWSRITECGPSATSLSISTPRFMGPGCRMSRSRGARSTRSRVTPKKRLYSRRLGMKPPCMRSSCRLSTLSTSAHSMASSMRLNTCTPRSPDLTGQQRARPAHADLGAQLRQPPDVGARHPRVQHVADDAHAQAVDAAAVVADGEQVQQRLRGMLVPTVACVDDVGGDPLRQEPRRARGRVADHDHVDAHGLQVARRVHQRLALGHAGARGRDVHRVRRQALLGELEGDARPGGRLEEEVDDGLAAEDRHLLDGALADLLERLGRVQDGADLVRAQVSRPSGPCPGRWPAGSRGLRRRHGQTSTASRPSSSGTSTSTTSAGPRSTSGR
jgi:hypothetical protein